MKPIGLFELIRISFGRCNAAQTFHWFIEGVLHGLPFAFRYVCGISIPTSIPNEHATHPQQSFEYFNHLDNPLSPDKFYEVFSADFCDHIDQHGIASLPDKVQSTFRPARRHTAFLFVSIDPLRIAHF